MTLGVKLLTKETFLVKEHKHDVTLHVRVNDDQFVYNFDSRVNAEKTFAEIFSAGTVFFLFFCGLRKKTAKIQWQTVIYLLFCQYIIILFRSETTQTVLKTNKISSNSVKDKTKKREK